MRKRGIAAALVFFAILGYGGFWFFKNYSPYQICLRHSVAEANKSGMTQESAIAYAEGLCASKLPLKE